MKRLSILSLIFLLAPVLVFGADFRSGDKVSISANETIKEDIYAGAGSVTSSGTIEGDFVAGGGTVLINGAVKGDVMVGGGTVNILGNVSDDIRVGGGNVLIQSAVGGDVIAGGGQLQILGSGIKGDIIAGGGLVQIEAPVGGDIKIGGGEIFINAPVAGSVFVQADKITFGPKAVVSGNLTYKSATEAKFESGAVVKGKIDFQKKEVRDNKIGAGFLKLAVLLKFLMLLTAGLLVALVFPRYAKEMVSSALNNPMSNLGYGLVFMIVFPIASIILLATLIGIPLGILGLIGFVGAMIWACLLSPIILGSLIHSWIRKPDEKSASWKVVVLGALIFTLLWFVPIIGWVIQFGFMLIALGTLIRMKWAIAKIWR